MTVPTVSAKCDWTTTEGIAAWLQGQLELEDYGAAFQVYRDGKPLDEGSAREAIVQTMAANMGRYQEALRRMAAKGENPDHYVAEVRYDPQGLVFVHNDFTIDLAGGLQVAGPRKTRRQKPPDKGRVTALEKKRQRIHETSSDDYLTHAYQCGYLLRNTSLDFLRSRKMQGTSVKMRIRNLTLDQLQQFTDAAGDRTLAALSTHEGTHVESDDGASYIYSGWIGFAREVIDFLNLEFLIDIDELKAQHRDVGGDTGFRTLESWGADSETVIGELVSRRPDIDAGSIRKRFDEGYSGSLV